MGGKNPADGARIGFDFFVAAEPEFLYLLPILVNTCTEPAPRSAPHSRPRVVFVVRFMRHESNVVGASRRWHRRIREKVAQCGGWHRRSMARPFGFRPARLSP